MSLKRTEHEEEWKKTQQKLAELRNKGQFGASAADFFEFWLILVLDVLEASEELGESDSTRRSFVRAAFAAIDGIFASIRDFALKLEEINFFSFDDLDRLVLQEIGYGLGGDGKVQSRPSYGSPDRRVRHLFSTLLRQHYPEYEIDVSTSGWSAFKSAILKRDRLTHPKRLSDLSVSDQDITAIHSAVEWLARELVFTVIATAAAAFFKFADRMLPNANTSDDDFAAWLKANDKNGDLSCPDKLQEAMTELRELQESGGLASAEIVLPLAEQLTEEEASNCGLGKGGDE